jgi:DNA-binding LacI/PurR family transcriptional regulator
LTYTAINVYNKEPNMRAKRFASRQIFEFLRFGMSMATIKDVAQLSGVSTTTVSEVLNKGWRPVNKETRKRVLEAAQQLDYRPNALARGLVGKRMNTVGVVFSQWEAPQSSPFVLGALLGVLSQGASRKQDTLLFNLEHWERAIQRLPDMCDGRCDGLLLMTPPEDSPLPEALFSTKMPCVLVSEQDRLGQVPSVDVDNFRAAFQMTNTLLQMGHRRVAFVRDPATHEAVTGFARERRAGYCQAMIAAGVYDPTIADLAGETAAMLAALSSERPTAFFCMYDDLALRLLKQLEHLRVRVPDEISVVGFDDIPQAATNRPALTTVRQPIKGLGERAVEMLLGLIDGAIPAGHRELLPTELVLRGSTAPPHV